MFWSDSIKATVLFAVHADDSQRPSDAFLTTWNRHEYMIVNERLKCLIVYCSMNANVFVLYH